MSQGSEGQETLGREIVSLQRQANEFARAGTWGPTAEAVNQRLVDIAPELTVAYTRLARCLRQRGEVEAAEALYRRVTQIDPRNVIAQNYLQGLQAAGRSADGGRNVSAATQSRGVPRSDPPALIGHGGVSRPGSDGLSILHERLESHFALLRASRNGYGDVTPIFALEHGLTDAELVLLRSEVCAAVLRGHLPRDSWLPFVVYATEIGYAYSGDEYWQTFESRTPGWLVRGDRHYIRRKFVQFTQAFGGAEPSGAWARHFSIICWPITHAVLPTDLQRHLARLLFDYRRVLTSELLDDPAELGKRLAARAWQASPRFQNFAQNTSLLGQVATALLVGNDEHSPYLLDSTLRRIVNDLSREREAQRWLRDAKLSAIRVQTHGFRPTNRASTGGPPSVREVRLPAVSDPVLSLRRDALGWTACIEVPDLSELAERLPAVHEEAGRLRARFAGVAGPPRARGQLLYPGRWLRLSEWPAPGDSLIQLENGSDAVNSLLSDQCVLSPGPRWLFRMREPSRATEVRGKFVRPGHEYIVLTRELLSGELPRWIAATESTTTGVHAYSIVTPSILGSEDLRVLSEILLTAVTDVEVRPAGLVPALWDGEGAAEWIAGETPIVGVSSSRAISKFILMLDGEPHLLPWPAGESEVFVRFSDLRVGAHDLHISLLPIETDEPVAEGSLELIVRMPVTRLPTGSFREGMMVLPTPVNPTLTELWDGRAALEVRGPLDVQVTVELSLTDRSNRPLARRRLLAALPIDSTRWQALFTNEFRGAPQIHRVYDAAESCVISISHPSLGMVSLRCEREFAPFRCAVTTDAKGPFVRFIDNTENGVIEAEVFDFVRPDVGIDVEVNSTSTLRRAAGGLITGRAGTYSASVILPPDVKDLGDLRNLNVPPEVSVGARSVDDVYRLIALASLWNSASLPANPFGENRRMAVLNAVTGSLCGLIGGNRWAGLELRIRRGSRPPLPELKDGVGVHASYRAIAEKLSQRIEEMRHTQPEGRVEPFAGILNAHAPGAGFRRVNTQFAELLLRLSSDPGSVATWSTDEVRAALQLVLDSPVLLRAARYLVLRIAFGSGDAGSSLGGWAWQ